MIVKICVKCLNVLQSSRVVELEHSMTAHINNNNELVALEILEKQCSRVLFYGENVTCVANKIRDTISLYLVLKKSSI